VHFRLEILICFVKDLDRIIKACLHGRREAGWRYVERGDYNIVSPAGDIVRPPEFLATLGDGIRLEMSIIKRKIEVERSGNMRNCPQCGRFSGTSSDIGWITWWAVGFINTGRAGLAD
jgi:hypothetical protein